MINQPSSSTKRIAKNTMFLYFRMLISMVVSLYTSRLVLKTLGVEDFGIYNVVAGFVAMFGFMTNSMVHASQRFLAFELGKGNIFALKRTFRATLSIYLILIFLVLLVAETVGLWFVYNKLNLPHGRLNATIILYQLSVAAFVFSIFRIPFNSAIIAHEKMGFYARISIVEVVLKLIIVFILVYSNFDKLELYGFLTLAVVGIISVIYCIYATRTFQECEFKLTWDKNLLFSMFGFAGWSFFDSIAFTAMNQGVNILINIFFGPAINAARGIAFQISAQVASFVYNYQTAAAPQIVKLYASNNISALKKLYYQTSRLSYYLLFIIVLPVLFEMEQILGWWLDDVPMKTVFFSRLVLINILIDCLSGTSNDVAKASGIIKYYQIFVGLTMVLNLPFSYLLLKFGAPAESTMVIAIFMSIISLVVRLKILVNIINFSMKEYFNKVLLKNILITLSALCLPSVFYYFIVDRNIFTFLLMLFISSISSILSVYFLGLENEEKIFVNNSLFKILIKLKTFKS